MSSGRFLIWTKMGDGVLVFSSKYPVMSVWLAPLKLLFSSPLPVEAQVFVASHRTIAFVVVATPLVSRVGPRTHHPFSSRYSSSRTQPPGRRPRPWDPASNH